MEQQEDIWKQKYLDHLDKLEKAEANWLTLENQLRQGINRVALAAQGVDSELDQHLNLLRKSIREGDDYVGLDRIVDNISTTVKRLDLQRQNDKEQENQPRDIFASMVKNIAFPKTSGKLVKALLKKIKKEKSNANIAPFAKELTVLINNILHEFNRSKPDVEASRPGFIQRFFKNNAMPVEDITGTHTESTDINLQSSKIDDDITSNISLPSVASENTVDESFAKQLGEFCFQLLCFIEFPATFDDSVKRLKEQVSAGVSSAESLDVLRSIADMIADVQSHLEKEKNDLQEFLQQLTNNLKEIDLHLSGAEAERLASLKSSHSFDEAVKAQVNHIQQSVDDASTLGQLKKGVNDRLQAIRSHLDAHNLQQGQHQQVLENALRLSNTRLLELEEETKDLQEKLSQEHEQAIHDALTGIFNRLAYEERVEQEYARWKRYNKPLSILVFDIDHFKKVNDTWGHKAGDKALKLIAGGLQQNLRETDFLARYGGEEFVVIMPETDIKAATAAANKLREAVKSCEFHYKDLRVNITVSCGIAQLKKSDTIESAFQRADSYLYKAKQAGRNRCYSND